MNQLSTVIHHSSSKAPLTSVCASPLGGRSIWLQETKLGLEEHFSLPNTSSRPLSLIGGTRLKSSTRQRYLQEISTSCVACSCGCHGRCGVLTSFVQTARESVHWGPKAFTIVCDWCWTYKITTTLPRSTWIVMHVKVYIFFPLTFIH